MAEGPNMGGRVYCVEEVLISGSFWKKCCWNIKHIRRCL